MPLAGFKPVVTASEQPQTYALDRAASGKPVVKQEYFQVTTDRSLKVIN
jgi:hypothetical protein